MRYGGRRSATRPQRRWARRVRKQARKELIRLAETHRGFVYGEAWSTLGALAAGDTATDQFIANVFGFLGLGVGDDQYTGNTILDPLCILRLSVTVNWPTAALAFSGQFPTVWVDAYLIAVNNQYVSTTAPRITSATEDTELFMKPIIFGGRIPVTHQLNGQGVKVIKKKKLRLQPPDSGSSRETTHTMKLVKKLRGEKTYETTFTAGGAQAGTVYLRGWNFYWLVLSGYNRTPTTGAQSANGIQIVGDRYLYYKDF